MDCNEVQCFVYAVEGVALEIGSPPCEFLDEMLKELLVVARYTDEHHIGVNPCVGKNTSDFFRRLGAEQHMIGSVQIFTHPTDVSAAVLATTTLWASVMPIHWLGISVTHGTLLLRRCFKGLPTIIISWQLEHPHFPCTGSAYLLAIVGKESILIASPSFFAFSRAKFAGVWGLEGVLVAVRFHDYFVGLLICLGGGAITSSFMRYGTRASKHQLLFCPHFEHSYSTPYS